MKLMSRVALAALVPALLAGCAPLIVGGAAVATALSVTDRRTTGTQVEDETIELRAASRLRDAFGDTVHVNVTSYNRQVLLTGEVPNANVRQQVEQVVSRVDNVRAIVNELTPMMATSLASRSSDTLVTGKVRASFVDASDLQANAFRVVTERGTVYLMGRVTQAEADRATNIARQVSGVNKVVRVLELITPAEIPRPPGAASPATVAPGRASAPPAESYVPVPGSPAPVTTSPVR